jgi:LmbE family N-acetylglucosaminyl deacetylase
MCEVAAREYRAVNVLAVGAHPLDIVFLCGGTLARYAQAGHTVAIAYLGLPMPESPDLSLEQLTATREEETARAFALIGATVHFLRFGLLDFCVTPENKARVADLIREADPDVILTHDSEDYLPDHQVTAELVQASSLLARQHIVQTKSPAIQTHSEIICMDTVAGISFRPEQFVNITDVIETKRSMVLAYESEIKIWENDAVVPWMEWMEVTCRYRGIQSGVRFAEAFRPLRRWGHLSPRRLLP